MRKHNCSKCGKPIFMYEQEKDGLFYHSQCYDELFVVEYNEPTHLFPLNFVVKSIQKTYDKKSKQIRYWIEVPTGIHNIIEGIDRKQKFNVKVWPYFKEEVEYDD